MNFIKNKFSKIFYYKSDKNENFDISQNNITENNLKENSSLIRSSLSSIVLISSISISTISCLVTIIGAITTISYHTLSITTSAGARAAPTPMANFHHI